ncbi:hypothetical protein J2W99_005344 [Bosea robiniae]|uniref:TniQ family protein n=1 Tax=Bosea TaxID=85413 RepID=UPI0028580705|nr:MULTISPECIES: TniQ family protein [Bosea]MDR6831589.1 hypothetical protein [Bosea robiniae]MDR6898298.1 hypothetical protein [Bosea sp. BE109]MDR7141695.1 hypothetical protein [Bosea sp. BE168]
MALVNRRAVQMGMEHIREFWDFLGGLPPHSKPYWGIYNAVDQIAAPIDAPWVFWATPLLRGEQIELMGNKYSREQIDRKNIRWCPHCLKAEPYFRAIWTVKAYKNCVLHGVPLQTNCAGCGEAQKWPRAGQPHNIISCKCERRFDCVAVNSPNERFYRKIDQWIFQNAWASASRERQDCWSHELLTDGMRMRHILESFSRLGAYALAPSVQFQETVEKTEPSELMDCGLEYASKEGFWSLLGKLVDANYRKETDLPSNKGSFKRLSLKYGQFADWLLSKRLCAPFERMIDLMLDHNRLHDASIHPDLNFNYASPGRYVTLEEVCRRLGIRMNAALALRLSPFDYDIPFTLPGNFPIPEHVLHRLLESGDTILGYKELAASLNAPENLARGLLSEGCLSEEPNRSASKQLVVKKIQINELMVRLDARHQAGREHDALVPLLKARTPFAGRARLVKLVLDGRLPVRKIEIGRRGLSRYMLAADEIERVVLADNCSVKMHEAMRLLNMNEGEIKILISHGHISVLMMGTQRLLNYSDVTSCLRTFVGERKAMKELQASRSILVKALSKLPMDKKCLLRDGDFVVYPRALYEKVQSLLDDRFGAQLKLAI